MPSLLDLVFFKEIEEGLKLINTDSMVLSPGDPPPENAVILGKMPDALKGLLELYLCAARSQEEAFHKLVKEGSTYNSEKIEASRRKINQLAETAKFFEALFWRAAFSQFGIVLGDKPFGYTENFDVYVEQKVTR